MALLAFNTAGQTPVATERAELRMSYIRSPHHYKGVIKFDGDGMWKATLSTHERHIYLGHYRHEVHAALRVNEAHIYVYDKPVAPLPVIGWFERHFLGITERLPSPVFLAGRTAYMDEEHSYLYEGDKVSVGSYGMTVKESRAAGLNSVRVTLTDRDILKELQLALDAAKHNYSLYSKLPEEVRAKYEQQKQQLQDWTVKEGAEKARKRIDRNIEAVIKRRKGKYKKIFTLEQQAIAEQRKVQHDSGVGLDDASTTSSSETPLIEGESE